MDEPAFPAKSARLISGIPIARAAAVVFGLQKRLSMLSVVGLLLLSVLSPAALGYQELELQAATDSLQVAGRNTVDALFWRSGFGPSIVGGPTHAGNTTSFTGQLTAFENLTGGTTPLGVRPVFIEYAAQPGLRYLDPTQNASDYSTQRWNASGAPLEVTAESLGMGAAADAAWAGYLLRTNHYANGTQAPGAPLVGATASDGILGLWLVHGLVDRVAALSMGAAFNGSALGAFNFTDGALNDNDPSNGWQAVPARLGVNLSTDPEPLFQGFAPVDNGTTVRGQAAVILGLAQIVSLSNPAGAHASLFDGNPFDASLYGAARPLLVAAVENAEAALWDATASGYSQPGGAVATGDLALYVQALARAESAADPAFKANATAARTRALSALASLSDAYGAFPGSYAVSGSTVTANWSTVTLASQAAALEAFASVFDATGLSADRAWMFKAGAALESRVFWNFSYHPVAPETGTATLSASTVAATLSGLRDLSLTGEEPLAVWRLVNATARLFAAAPLTLGGAQAPAVIGASFGWNASSTSPLGAAADFEAEGALYASLEFLTLGPEFYASVGGGVSVTERAALVLHNATSSDVGAAVDSLHLQIAALAAQISALQASFDALSGNVTNTTDRLNLSLENETIDLARIADLQANLTALRYTVENATHNESVSVEALISARRDVENLSANFTAVSYNLTLALQNASGLAGRLNQTLADLETQRTAMANANATIDQRSKEAAGAEGRTAIGAAVAFLTGLVLMFFLQWLGVLPKTQPPAAAEPKGKDEKGPGERSQK